MKLADDKKLGGITPLEIDKDILKEQSGFEQSNRNGMVDHFKYLLLIQDFKIIDLTKSMAWRKYNLNLLLFQAYYMFFIGVQNITWKYL